MSNSGTSSGREARRRRILEGGSDRLALITGRLPTPSSSTSHDSVDLSVFSAAAAVSDTNPASSAQPSAVHNEEDKPSNYTIPKNDELFNSNQIDGLLSGSRELLSRKSETLGMPSKAPASEIHAQPEPSRTVRQPPQPSPQGQRQSAARLHLHELFTYQQVSSAVYATEQTRMFCSLAMAFLVVLSHMGFPIVSSSLVRSIIQFRPLFLVLVTNITFILHHLIFEKQRSSERAGREASKSTAGADGYYGWAEEAGKVVEMAFMAQILFGSLIMDCCVYAVIVACGLSVA